MLSFFNRIITKLFTIIFIVLAGFLFFQNDARAAITPTQVSATGATTGATTQAVTAFTPAANTLYLLWTIQTFGSTPATPTVSCANGLTMVQENTVTFGTVATPTRRITLFRGLRTTAGTNNTCTITWNQTSTGGGYSLVSFAGVDTSGTNGSGAVAQSVTGATDSAATTGLSITLASIISGSTTAGGFSNARNTANSLSAGSGYTAGTSWNFNTPATSARAEWNTTGSATVNMTQSNAVDIAGIAVEVKQPASGSISASPTTCTILSGASTCDIPFTWSISNAISPNLFNATTNNTYSISASGTGVSFAITNGSNTVQARDSSTVLASTSVTGSCTSGTSWNGSICAASSAVPTVTSPTATSITATEATLGANVTDLGTPASISERGTCWGTTASPVTNCVAEGSTTTGIFTHVRTGMSPNTLYYYRGYATNSTGTGYSVDGTFTTNAGPSATLSASPTTCTISSGASTCDIPFTWTISNATLPNLYNATIATQYTNGASGTNVSFAITNGDNIAQARDSSTVLASTTVTASCISGTSWNGSTCAANPAVPTVTSPAVTSIISTGATLGANVTSLGVPSSISERGTCWGTTASPVTNCVAEGSTTTGIFTHVRTGMSPNTLYYYRGYATNSTGTGYSTDGTFTTSQTPSIPTVTSPTVTAITSTGATLGANVTSLGIPASISERGTCWGTTASPVSNCTAEGGTTTGIFTHARTGMSASTPYFYRGYATNSTGTGYSTDGTFTTASVLSTTLADGTAPSSVAIGPDSAVTDLDYFTLQTSAGTDTVTAITVSLLPTGAFNNITQIDLTNNSNFTQCPSVSNPASNTISFSSCSISVTSTPSEYKVRITPKTHSSMPAVPGASYATTGTVTSFTSTNSQSNTDATSATITVDNLSPNGASPVSGSGGDTNINLNWTSSNSADFNATNGNVVYRWVGSSAGAEVPSEGSTASVGATNGTATTACVISSSSSTALSKVDGTGGSTGCTTFALTNGQNYTYKVFQKDTHGNYDAGVLMGTFAPSATPTVTIGTGADPVATTIAPGSGVADVNYFTLQSNIGTESITSVTIDLSANSGTIDSLAITNDTNTVLGSVSSPVAGSNTISVVGMSAGTSMTTFKIRVTPVSHALMPAVPGAGDAITAPATAWVGSHIHTGTDTNPNALTIDNLSPGNVTASVTAGDTQVSANWTNPADTDFVTGGTVLVLRSTSIITDTPTEGATYISGGSVGSSIVACVITGTPPATSCTDTGLTNGTAYHYKIFTQDSHGNYSATGVIPSNSPATPTTIVIPTFIISATASAGGTILPAGNTSVAQGNSQSYVITPDSGYDIETLLIDGGSVVPTSLYTFTNVQTAHTISATFAISSTVVALPSPGASPPTTVTFTGKAFAGGSVAISKKLLSTDSITGRAVTPDADGSFSISFVGILQGLQSFGLVAKDKNGLSAQTKLFLFDTVSNNLVEKEILVPPTIDVLYGQVTRGADATVFGYASPNYSVHLYADGILTGEVRTGGNGFYEFKTPTGALSFGQHKIRGKQVDPISKKESDFSTTRTFNVSQLTVTKADFSGDGKIDIQDWSIFLSRWLSKDAIIKNSIDITGDGKVDISDFSIFIKTLRKK